jgi:hypothetical protein
MASVQSTGVVLVNGFDLSCYLRSLENKGETNMHDTTTFCTTGFRSFSPGLTERGFSAEGFFAYDGTTDAKSIDRLFHEALSSTSGQLVSFAHDGIDVGDPAVMMNTKMASHNVSETVGEIIMSTFEAKATKTDTEAIYGQGIWLMSQTVTGAVNGTSSDRTASATGYLAQVHNTDSDGTATVKVQHSTNNSTWVDLVDFGAVASRGAEQAYNTATSVNRYVRAIVTAIGGTTAKVSVALKHGYTG